MKDKNLAVFDLDGVILESIDCKTIAFTDLYSQYGVNIQNKIIKHHLNNGGISRYEKIKFYHEKFLNIKLSNNEFNKLLNQFSHLVLKQVLNSEFVEDVQNFLMKISKKFTLVLSTGTPTNEAIQILKHRKLDKFFLHIFGSPESKKNHMAKLFNDNNYQNKYFFGDAMTDYDAAIEFEMKFILRHHDKNNFMLNKSNIYKIIKNYKDLIVEELIND